jgi:hypothetical protein
MMKAETGVPHPYSRLRPAIHHFVGRQGIWLDDFPLRLRRREGWVRFRAESALARLRRD